MLDHKGRDVDKYAGSDVGRMQWCAWRAPLRLCVRDSGVAARDGGYNEKEALSKLETSWSISNNNQLMLKEFWKWKSMESKWLVLVTIHLVMVAVAGRSGEVVVGKEKMLESSWKNKNAHNNQTYMDYSRAWVEAGRGVARESLRKGGVTRRRWRRAARTSRVHRPSYVNATIIHLRLTLLSLP